MDATSYSSEVWGSSGLVLLALVALSFVLAKVIGPKRLLFWCVFGLALVLSGPAVRALVDLWTSAPNLRVVPGAVATWAPGVVMLGAGLLLWRARGADSDRPLSGDS